MTIHATDDYNGLQTVIGEMETRRFRGGFVVHANTDRNYQIDDALELAEGNADVFWGLRREVNGETIPQTLLAKISLIRDAVKLIPEPEGLPLQANMFIDGEIDLGTVKKFEGRKVDVQLDYDLAAIFKKSPQSALEAYRTASVRELAHTALIEIGDPVTRIIDVYEQYQDRTTAIEDHALRLGARALEHVAFAAGGQAFVELLGSANRVFHEGEVARRGLSR